MLNEISIAVRKELTVNHLMDIIKELKVRRIVRTEEDEKFFDVIVCGVFRIRKDKNKDKITLHKLTYKNSWKWERTNKLPMTLPVFYKKGNQQETEAWLNIAIRHIVNSLLNRGCEFTGKINVILHKGKVIGSYLNNYPMYMDEAERGYRLQKTEKRTYKLSKKGMFINNHGKVKYDDTRYHQPIDMSIMQRLPYIKECNYLNAFKSFNLAIRKAINPDILSRYIDIKCYTFLHSSNVDDVVDTHNVFNMTVESYFKFSNSPIATIEYNPSHLSPFYRLIPTSSYQLIKKNQDDYNFNKTKTISYLIKINSLSIKDLKFLRAAPKVYSHFIAGLVEHHKANHHSIDFAVKLAMNIFRLEEIKHYPVNIILSITRHSLTMLIRLGCIDDTLINNHIRDMMMIISRWLQYHVKLYKNIGYIKNRNRWRTEMNYLHHALDWINAEDVILRKNQMWPSFYRLAEEWNRCVNDDYDVYKAIPESWNGLKIDLNSIKHGLTNLRIKEIVTYADLKNEGREMEHCVASYASWCANGQYKAFSLYLGEERATLGLAQMQNSMKYFFDQIRGKNNDSVSATMEKAGRKILKVINQHLSKKSSNSVADRENTVSVGSAGSE